MFSKCLYASQALPAVTDELRNEIVPIDREFLEAKLATARFYFAKILPGTTSMLASITAGADPVMAEGI